MMHRFSSLTALAMLGAGMALAAPAAMAQDSAGAAQDQGDEEYSNEIIVTAQGRSQSLADVPVAISAVSAETLSNSGTNDIRDLTQVAPSLLVSSTGNEANGSARIRGIGTVGDNPGLESSVVVLVDGVYRSRSGNALSELGPLEQIEVLRGPQGTLGGRNSTAGLISIHTAKPTFELSGHGSATYGNFDAIRIEAGINTPVNDKLAVRVDGVYFERDGFYTDAVNNVSVNDRERYLIRAQALFEPTDDISFRLIADYSNKDEACCAATFVQPDFAPLARISPGLNSFVQPTTGAALTSTANPIIPILLALGQDPRALTQSTFNRTIYPTAGRSYDGETEDYGISGELNWALGGMDLTSITSYRHYDNNQASDTDYTGVDILYRAPGPDAGARRFKTFTQEFRLNGNSFDDKLDWLVGAFYTNEKLQTRDNLRFGTQYGAFAPCRIVLAVNPALVSPGSTGCLSAGGRAALQAANGGAGAFGAATPLIFSGLDILAQVNDVGGTGDVFNQRSESIAFFTHNIFHVTDKFDVTIGVRYTHESKKMNATFANDNIFCPQNRALLSGLLSGPLAGLAGGLIALSCQGNSNAELDGVSIDNNRNENQVTGTGVLSYKVTPDLLAYASYSRGYKAGGFNLDRSALANPLFLDANNLNPDNLEFEQESVDAFEAGLKYSTPSFSVGLSAFRQQFNNFQLNTFNGSVFLVQSINGCKTDLAGADRDASAATGACNADDVKYGVVAQGVEFESTVSPISDVVATFGVTYSDTSYGKNLVGSVAGAPLDPALRLLPGDNLSNAPELVATTSFTWTPPIGNTGLSGLFFINARLSDDYNTGSDLLLGKEQDGYFLVNGRVGVVGPDDAWAVEVWANNLFDKDYTQVAFNTPFIAPQQTYSTFLAEPRTYGVTVRGKF